MRIVSAKLLKPCPVNKWGHLVVNLSKDNKPKTYLVHRLVLEAFVGPCPVDMEGCHEDGNPANNNLTNLRWDTSAGNKLDTSKHGRNGNAVINPGIVHQIRREMSQGKPTIAAVARKLGLTWTIVKNVSSGKHWKHVEIDLDCKIVNPPRGA
jgi:hypothetical protein